MIVAKSCDQRSSAYQQIRSLLDGLISYGTKQLGSVALLGEEKVATTAFESGAAPELILRPPRRQDGPALHALVAACPQLDLNSSYAYLLLCQHHADTCVIAERSGVVVGAITAYFPPLQAETLFIWQVAVASQMRQQKLGSRMLQHLLQRCMQNRPLGWVETTISPSNHPSHQLFTGFARQHGVAFTSAPFFAADDFGGGDHEEEHLYRLGPWDPLFMSTIFANHRRGIPDAYI